MWYVKWFVFVMLAICGGLPLAVSGEIFVKRQLPWIEQHDGTLAIFFILAIALFALSTPLMIASWRNDQARVAIEKGEVKK